MAIYTTFFLCEAAVLPGTFPGWRPPLAEPVVREFKNPFTGELTRVSSREPDWSDDAGEDAFKPDYKVVAIQGDYRAYLEGRLGPGIRALPHWCAKGLTEVELAPLGEAARIETVLEPALFAAPSLGAMLDEINPDLQGDCATLGKLAYLDNDDPLPC